MDAHCSAVTAVKVTSVLWTVAIVCVVSMLAVLLAQLPPCSIVLPW